MWACVNSLGWIIGLEFGWFIFRAALDLGMVLIVIDPPGLIITPILFATVIGLTIGLVQWLLIRRYIFRSGWWIVASMGGHIVGNILIYVSTPYLLSVGRPLQNNVVAGALVGVSIGTAQWLVLRKQFYQSGLWILGNTVGWSISYLLSSLMAERIVTCHDTCQSSIGGMTLGIITGWMLMRLLHHSTAHTRQLSGEATQEV